MLIPGLSSMGAQPPPLQDPATRPQVKQPPPKKEKMQCLFCTKPARLTCHHKLCKKCCNERHPNDCKAHDSGPVSDKDKSKPTRLHTVQPTQPHAAYPKADVKSVPLRAESSQHDHHALRAVPPGPHAVNLAEAVQAHHQEAQESARWQAHAHSQSQQQRSAEAEEALQRYAGAAELLGQLFQGPTPSAEARPDREPLQLQGVHGSDEPAPNGSDEPASNGSDEPAPKRVCQEENILVQMEGRPGTHTNLLAEDGSEEPAAAVHGNLHDKLTSLQAGLGLPANRTSIVL